MLITCVVAFDPHCNLVHRGYYCHFIDGKMEVKPSGTSLKVLEEVSMDIGLAQAS
jgi:hypothetical protein